MAALTTIAATAAIAGTLYAGYQTYRAGKAQRRAADVQRRQRDEQLARQRRSQIAAQRRRRAQIINAASQVGASGSSGELGSLGNLSARLGDTLGFLNRGQQRAAEFEGFAGEASSRQIRGSIGQSATSIFANGSTIFSVGETAPSSINMWDRTANNVRQQRGGQGSLL